MTGFTANFPSSLRTPGFAAGSVLCLALAAGAAPGQVLTVGPGSAWTRYAKVQPTQVDLSNTPLTGKTRTELIRMLDAEQGFAVRPVPKGGHGLGLHANGQLDPGGTNYLHALDEKGVSVKPGDRVILSDVKIEKDRIVFDLNGGPDRKHKWLRHVQIGANGSSSPVVQDDPVEPAGSRITLLFKGSIPEVTGPQVKALLEPIIDFNFKSPVQAFVDPLPPQIRKAILDHEVLVGMSTEMVIYAVGKPDHKSREVEGQMPYEEWIYGDPPHEVQFVRINGNRVIRVEIAKLGQDPIIRDKNEVEAIVEADNQRMIQLGDVPADPHSAPQAPPSLRKPGDAPLPDSTGGYGDGQMKPVQFPEGMGKPKPLPPDLQQPTEQSNPGGVPASQPDPAPASPPASHYTDVASR